ncbi:MAG TPA: phage tail protein, partial [Pyrinomonadaceae bacterium]|nr:phage tail protein [Pyrinomonadaceae bacterium]
ACLRLAQEKADKNPSDCLAADAFTPLSIVLAYMLPPRLARGCGRCDWFLVHKTRLMRHDCCTPGFLPAWSDRCDQRLLSDAVAVAARGHRVAVSDAQAKRIWIWEGDGQRLIGSINTERLTADLECDRYDSDRRLVRPRPMAFTTWGELLVADLDTNSIWRFGSIGEVRGKLKLALPSAADRGSIKYLAVSDDCSIWVVTGYDNRSLELWQASREDSQFKQASIKKLQESFKPTGLKAADDEIGFCIDQCGPEGLPVTRCFGWDGEPTEKPIAPPGLPRLNQQGQLLTRALDSGIPRCRWHRVRLDAEVPSGTNLEIALATSEPDSSGAEPPPQGNSQHESGWEDFKPGVPHHLDWQVAPFGVLDFLIDQPPGRLLYVRLRLKGNGNASPVVRRVRLDFPRVSSLENLPSVYRDNPEAEDFTERFLTLFDASLSDLDRAIERAPALLDPEGVPAEVLPWLGSFLDLVFDPAWKPELRRRILRALPDLYRRRGTISGLSDTIKIIFDVTPAIQELATERAWGSVARREGPAHPNTARLGSVRLFGKSRARFRLNTSALGRAPLKSYGNPDLDPLLAQAFRLRVLVPPLAVTSANARRSLEQLVVSQKPAHTTATVRFGGDGFLLGDKSAVGVDTIFGALPPPVVGKSGNVRLGHMSVLRRGRRGPASGIRLGETSVVGVQTIAA